jgi:hypothetical protein
MPTVAACDQVNPFQPQAIVVVFVQQLGWVQLLSARSLLAVTKHSARQPAAGLHSCSNLPKSQSCYFLLTHFLPTFATTAANMWFRRARLRLSLRTRRPKFQEIGYNDDGKVRPVTRGKAKQFTGFEEPAPTPKFKDAAAYRMRSNLSHSSQIPLTGNDNDFFTFEKAAQGRTKYFTSRYKQ